MRTLRQAAELLSAAPRPRGLLALAVVLGFEAEERALDAATRASLGLPPDLIDVRLARGRGALRALLITAPRGIADPPAVALEHRVVRQQVVREAHRLRAL